MREVMSTLLGNNYLLLTEITLQTAPGLENRTTAQ